MVEMSEWDYVIAANSKTYVYKRDSDLFYKYF